MALFSQGKVRVGVLRGGPSPEYDTSLQSGEHVLALLRSMSDLYDPVDIFVSKDGDWHYSGLKQAPHKVIMHTDVIWNALHGAYGEDGRVQKILQGLHIPFTGSLAVPSALSMNKQMAKTVFEEHGLLTPKHELITAENFNDETLGHIFRNYLQPVMIKPADSGSALGTSLAHGVKEIREAIERALEYSKKVLVEEHIRGKATTCAVLENARGERLYTLVLVDNLGIAQNKKIEQMAKRAHEVLGLRHYSCSDFIITPKGNIYILETNSLPKFTRESHLPRSLEATGWQTKDFVHHIVGLALGR